MKTLKRNSFIKALVILMVCCVCGFVLSTFGMGSASANATVSDKLIMHGASIRFQQEGETAQDSTAGIRFEARIKKSDYNTDTGLQNVTEVGIILVPVSENVSDANFVVGTTGVAKVVIQGGGQELNNAFSITYLGEDYYSYKAYIYNIPASEYFNQIKARAYAVCDGETLYSEIATRSIAEVANIFLNDVDTEESDDYPYLVEEGVYSRFDAKQRGELAKYFENAPAPEISASATLPAKAHKGDTITLPTYTAIDWTGADAQVEVSVSQDGNAVAVEDGKFTVASYVDHVITVTITDSNGSITTKTYTISVYEENFVCSFNNADKQFISDCSDVEIGGQTVHALRIQGKDKYNYANAPFTAEKDWENNYAKFKIYNPTSYETKFAIWAVKDAVSYTTTTWAGNYVVLEEITIASGETITVSLDGWYDYNTYPYLSIYMTAADNGGGSSTQHINTQIYIYDFELVEQVRQDPTTTADYKYTQGTSSGWTLSVNEDKTYIKEGVYSMKVKTTANHPTLTVSEVANVKLTEMGSMSFDIYNAATVDMPISVLFTNSTQSTRNTVAKAGEWTTIKVSLSTIADLTDGSMLQIKSTYNWFHKDDATVAEWTAIKNGTWYLDNFQYVPKTTAVDFNSEDYLWAKASTNTNAFSLVNGDPAYCVEGSLYSWHFMPNGTSSITSKNDYSATINWANYSTLSFKAYNPTEYKVRYYIDLVNSAGTRVDNYKFTLDLNSGWNDITLDLAAKIPSRATGCSLRISTAWNEGSNEVLGSTTYTTAFNPIWYAVKTQGVYLDGFKLA